MAAFSGERSWLGCRIQGNARVEILLRAIPVMDADTTSAFACRRRLTKEPAGLVGASRFIVPFLASMSDSAITHKLTICGIAYVPPAFRH
jgi:hypothetical protein